MKIQLKTLTYLLLLVSLFAKSQSNALLWRISGNGVAKPSYLYGTVHLQDKRVFEFNDSVMACIKTADAFATELLMSDLKSKELVSSMIADKGSYLNEILTEKEYQKVGKKFKSVTGYDLSTFNSLKPFGIFATMSQSMFSKDMDTAMDEYLSNYAQSFGKPLLAVEELDDQIKVFNTFGKEELLQAIDEWQDFDIISEKLIHAYREENLKDITKLTKESMSSGYEEFEEKALGDRNVTMTESIAEMVKKQSTFIAIGVSHLGANDGVLLRLKNKGFKIEPIIAPKTKDIELETIGVVKTSSFKVKFPAKPEKTTSTAKTEVGDIEITNYTYQNESAKDGLYYCLLGSNEYPKQLKEALKELEVLKSMYENTLKSSFKAMNVKIEKSANIKFKGTSARKAKGTLNGLNFEMMCVYKNGVMYYSQTITEKSEKATSAQKKFLNSLVIE